MNDYVWENTVKLCKVVRKLCARFTMENEVQGIMFDYFRVAYRVLEMIGTCKNDGLECIEAI